MKRFVFALLAVTFLSARFECRALFNSEECFFNINKVLQDGDVTAALNLLAQWEKAEPDNPDLYIAKAIIDENSPEPSIERQSDYYETAIRLCPDKLNYRIHYIEGLVAADEIDRAIKVLDDIYRRVQAKDRHLTAEGDTLSPIEMKNELFSRLVGAEINLLEQSIFENISRFVDKVESVIPDTNLMVNLRYYRGEQARKNYDYVEALEDMEYIEPRINPDQRRLVLNNMALLCTYTGDTIRAINYAQRLLADSETTDDMKKTMNRIIDRYEKPQKPLPAEKFFKSELPYVASILQPSSSAFRLFDNPDRVIMYMRGSNRSFDKVIEGIQTRRYRIDNQNMFIWTLPENSAVSFKYMAIVPVEGRFRVFVYDEFASDDEGEKGWVFEYYYTDDDLKTAFYSLGSEVIPNEGEFASTVAYLIEQIQLRF